MAEKQNPWLDEGARYDKDEKRQNIRNLKFSDNSSFTVRIMPSKKSGDFPFHGYKQHWIPQNGQTIGKPITHGIDERCPVCEWLSTQWEEVHRLKEEEDMTDKSPEVVALLKKISAVSAKTRYDMNVLHREDLFVVNDETKEKEVMPKRMSVGGTVYKEIFSFAKKWGSPSNEQTGYDLEIITSGEKERREYRVVPDRDASPLTADEKKLIDKCYNLKELRSNSTLSDIQKALENAKTPYNEINCYVDNDETQKYDDVDEVEKEIDEVVQETSSQKNEKTESVTQSELEQTESKVEDTETIESVDDEHNFEVYECKGDFDENDKMCADCPVRNQCEEAHPYYVKAGQLKIDIDPHKLSKQIIDEVKKAEASQTTSKRGKRIPF